MKKQLNSIFLALIILTLSNCTTDITEESTYSASTEINNILSLSTNEQEIAYRMLTEPDQYNIWIEKHNRIKILGYDKFLGRKLSNKETQLIHDVYKSLRKEYFINKEKSSTIDYFSRYLPKIKITLLEYFTLEECTRLFSSLETNQRQESKIDDQLPDIDCGCNQNDDWCTTGDCVMPCTDTSNIGCGWWMAQECNGACGSYSIN